MKVLLADDHGLFRDSMAIWLKQYPEPMQIEFAIDWASLIKKLDNSFTLIMLDLNMPGMFGATSIGELAKSFPNTPILVVSANEDPQTINACIEHGASGYITKASDGQEIIKAVSTVLNGEIYQPTSYSTNTRLLAPEALNKRQFELLSHLATGETNKIIAQKMRLSEGTIKQYVSQILDILDVDNRTQAGNKARKILGF
ncbi:MAG: response regulator transcription factor [Piscirickettsiaceae bacterium]|nr:response regulator transcription factor [Piscirickettsiaceae bacterium]